MSFLKDDGPSTNETVSCPVCNREFEKITIEEHVNKCLFLNTLAERKPKRNNSYLKGNTLGKKMKLDSVTNNSSKDKDSTDVSHTSSLPSPSTRKLKLHEGVPLAEQMRPLHLDDIVGQMEAFGPGSMLRSILEQKKVPNMILWGPPGCGKTSIANVVAQICKESNNLRFVKLSATMAGVNDIKEVVKIAKNEAQYKRQTVLFMDEIHRFNKLQQDSFLAHVENGTIILIGATTENPSFSLNNALLSRCRVVVMSKLSVNDVLQILERTVKRKKLAIIVNSLKDITEEKFELTDTAIIENNSLKWLAEICDGDARIALGALELALTVVKGQVDTKENNDTPIIITLDDLKNGIKRSHVLYDRQGEEHYNIISAIHKSIRASDDNAALYWTTRALHSGEDPLYIARRLVRIACEDVGLGDQNAIVEAVACLHGCQHIGMPECDVLLVQCAVSLARAPKSREVYDAMKKCQLYLKETKGPLPSVPLHLRNAPTKLMKELGYAKGYNLLHKNESGLSYMPEGMENVNFLKFE